jgi:hypothetical protein
MEHLKLQIFKLLLWVKFFTARASVSTASARPDTVPLKFVMSEDRQAVLRGRKGLVKTKLGLDKDLTLAQQACKSEMRPLFKEAKVASKRAFWCTIKLFVNGTQICPPSSV